MNYFNDILMVYKKSAQKTISSLKSNPAVLLAGLIINIIYFIGSNFLYRFGSGAGGFIVGIINYIFIAFLISNFYKLLSDLLSYNRIDLKDVINGYRYFFTPVINTFFIIALITMFVPEFLNMPYTLLILMPILYLCFNPLAEMIYIGNSQSIYAFSESLKFMKDNLLHWLIPTAIYLGIISLLGYLPLNLIISSVIIDIPLGLGQLGYLSIHNPISLISPILFSVITTIYAVFRAHEFSILHKSSMRKRQYMGEI